MACPPLIDNVRSQQLSELVEPGEQFNLCIKTQTSCHHVGCCERQQQQQPFKIARNHFQSCSLSIKLFFTYSWATSDMRRQEQ